ncbi:MAG: hypothetical protein WAL47_00540, partial [Pyrinomonadaceae bacterium]
ILLYAIHLQNSAEDEGRSLGMEGEALMYELTATSGGYSLIGKIFRRQRDADEIFETIANELRNQLSLEIEPRGVTSGKKWHKIKVKLTSTSGDRAIKNLTLRTRAGYYSFLDSN